MWCRWIPNAIGNQAQRRVPQAGNGDSYLWNLRVLFWKLYHGRVNCSPVGFESWIFSLKLEFREFRLREKQACFSFLSLLDHRFQLVLQCTPNLLPTHCSSLGSANCRGFWLRHLGGKLFKGIWGEIPGLLGPYRALGCANLAAGSLSDALICHPKLV